MSVISNTTVISNFACIGQLDLIRQLHRKIYISVQVYEEIQAGINEGYLFYTDIEKYIYPFAESGWIHLTNMCDESEFCLYGKLPLRLHKGEISCLSIACHRKWLFLTDDRDARNQARQMKIRLSGSLGCLILAAERKLCSVNQAEEWLHQMILNGYYSPVTDLTQLLNSEKMI